ncbi:hypothetical protein RchiOBHm_Chr7g0238391 [Rosa chinensis]|uniref:Uncharacterized protein n=1 Tax=Rosa chinensis TaxID=74649 RepID=A0A2P6PHF1_ROSCH|nr:hypothetical protein RchiOBHm_Chr7g0238391 [Rosa chinensis]
MMGLMLVEPVGRSWLGTRWESRMRMRRGRRPRVLLGSLSLLLGRRLSGLGGRRLSLLGGGSLTFRSAGRSLSESRGGDEGEHGDQNKSRTSHCGCEITNRRGRWKK